MNFFCAKKLHHRYLKRVYTIYNFSLCNMTLKSFSKYSILLFPDIGYDIATIAQKMKFSIKDFFNKCDQIRSFLRIWSHLLKKSLMENFIFCAVDLVLRNVIYKLTNENPVIKDILTFLCCFGCLSLLMHLQ